MNVIIKLPNVILQNLLRNHNNLLLLSLLISEYSNLKERRNIEYEDYCLLRAVNTLGLTEQAYRTSRSNLERMNIISVLYWERRMWFRINDKYVQFNEKDGESDTLGQGIVSNINLDKKLLKTEENVLNNTNALLLGYEAKPEVNKKVIEKNTVIPSEEVPQRNQEKKSPSEKNSVINDNPDIKQSDILKTETGILKSEGKELGNGDNNLSKEQKSSATENDVKNTPSQNSNKINASKLVTPNKPPVQIEKPDIVKKDISSKKQSDQVKADTPKDVTPVESVSSFSKDGGFEGVKGADIGDAKQFLNSCLLLRSNNNIYNNNNKLLFNKLNNRAVEPIFNDLIILVWTQFECGQMDKEFAALILTEMSKVFEGKYEKKSGAFLKAVNNSKQNDKKDSKVIIEKPKTAGRVAQKVKEVKEGSAKQKDMVFNCCIGVYNSFCKRVTGYPASIDKIEGAALKSIIIKLRAKAKDQTDKGIIQFFEWVLQDDNWKVQEEFYQKQIKLTQINSNLPNLLFQIKNKFQNDKGRNRQTKQTGILPANSTQHKTDSL